MKNFKKGFLITFICVLSAAICKKDDANQGVSLNTKTKAGLNYPFKWETFFYMPSSPNYQDINMFILLDSL